MLLLHSRSKMCCAKAREAEMECYMGVGWDWMSGRMNWHQPDRSTLMKLWFSVSQREKGMGGSGKERREEIQRNGWRRENRKRERKEEEREGQQRKSSSLCSCLSDWAPEIRGVPLQRLYISLSLFVLFILSYSLSPHSSKPWAAPVLLPQKYSPIKWIV